MDTKHIMNTNLFQTLYAIEITASNEKTRSIDDFDSSYMSSITETWALLSKSLNLWVKSDYAELILCKLK